MVIALNFDKVDLVTYVFHAASKILHVAEEQFREVTLPAEKYAKMYVQLEKSTWQLLFHHTVIHLWNST